MTVDFCDYFWGEKNNGFDVLYHNMKYGLVASKEFADFLRERANIEESHSKLLNKIAKQAGNGCSHGTFAPLWLVLKSSSEKLSNLHMQLVQKVQELLKEVNKYNDEFHKRHKLVKEEESGTLDVVQAIQSTTVTLQKAKDTYTQRCLEFERLKRDNASIKEMEKAEVKLKKAQEEYKNFVKKYSSVREEFEKKMTVSCRHFQELEESYLKQMKEFLNTYSQVLENNHESIGQVHIDFHRQCVDMTVEKLLEQFVRNKHTGLEKPGPVEFEEPDLLGLMPPCGQTPDSSDKTTNGDKPKKEGFLKSRREKKKEKKAKKKKPDGDTSSNKEEKSDVEEKEDSRKSETPTPDVDDEGFSIRPKSNDPWENDKGSFYSSSDSDTEDENTKKIHVEIKPLSNGTTMSASVDELRATVESMSISPLTVTSMSKKNSGTDSEGQMKRSQSVSQQLGGKSSNDLLGLNLFPSPTASSASTPTGAHPYAPLQSPTALQSPTTLQSPTMGVNSPTSTRQQSTPTRYTEFGDLFAEVGEMQPTLPPKQSKQNASRGGTPTSGGTGQNTSRGGTPTSGNIAIPRPPSRKGVEGPSPRGRVSPSTTMSRTDSVGSLEFRAAGVPVGTSRGPSPLTIGMADTIPLAVAFQEVVHACFRGADETKCQVKLMGDMMMSFPAGIIQVLANNPNPAQLSFKVKNSNRLENILPNKQLIIIDHSQNNSESTAFEFNMGALTSLLRRQSEQNPAASYFNVDILKYQICPKNGAVSCPFQIVAYWKCSEKQTDLRIDYKYNSHGMASPTPLLNLTVAVPVDGGVQNMQSKPAGQWIPDSNRALWKFTELSQHSDNHGVGSLRARFDITSGPGSPGTIAAQFNCEGTTLSSAKFELTGSGYRVSLVKRRFVSGKYICDTEPDFKHRYASPPGSQEVSDC